MPAVLDRPAVMPAIEPTTRTDELVLFVTQADIDNGHQADAKGCAIALAAQRQLCDMGWWTMHNHALVFAPKLLLASDEYWYSAEAERFVVAFDRDPHSVQPTTLRFTREPAAGRAGQ